MYPTCYTRILVCAPQTPYPNAACNTLTEALKFWRAGVRRLKKVPAVVGRGGRSRESDTPLLARVPLLWCYARSIQQIKTNKNSSFLVLLCSLSPPGERRRTPPTDPTRLRACFNPVCPITRLGNSKRVERTSICVTLANYRLD